jgi:hypothetical protein
MNKPICFICNHQVIGLSGQDLTLDTFYLHGEPEDRQVVADNAFGDCHLLCLVNSKWGRFWGKRVLGNLKNVRRYGSIFESSEVSILRNDVMLESAVVRADGWMTFVSDRPLLAARTIAGGRLLPVVHPLTIDLSENVNLIERIQPAFEANTSVNLFELVVELGLQDYLLYPEAIRDGDVRRLDTDAGTEPITRSHGEVLLTAMLSYHQLLPEEIAQKILEHLKHHSSGLDGA